VSVLDDRVDDIVFDDRAAPLGAAPFFQSIAGAGSVRAAWTTNRAAGTLLALPCPSRKP
jgi:hypothetical protein